MTVSSFRNKGFPEAWNYDTLCHGLGDTPVQCSQALKIMVDKCHTMGHSWHANLLHF